MMARVHVSLPPQSTAVLVMLFGIGLARTASAADSRTLLTGGTVVLGTFGVPILVWWIWTVAAQRSALRTRVATGEHLVDGLLDLLTEERRIMRMHPIYGRNAILQAERQLGSTSFLGYAREITFSHHERWDGAGYPEGLAGEEIPLSGRLMAIADVYDALISRRVYKPAYSHQEATETIRNEAGAHFDPLMVEAFCAVAEEFDVIAHRFKDTQTDSLGYVDP